MVNANNSLSAIIIDSLVDADIVDIKNMDKAKEIVHKKLNRYEQINSEPPFSSFIPMCYGQIVINEQMDIKKLENGVFEIGPVDRFPLMPGTLTGTLYALLDMGPEPLFTFAAKDGGELDFRDDSLTKNIISKGNLDEKTGTITLVWETEPIDSINYACEVTYEYYPETE